MYVKKIFILWTWWPWRILSNYVGDLQFLCRFPTMISKNLMLQCYFLLFCWGSSKREWTVMNGLIWENCTNLLTGFLCLNCRMVLFCWMLCKPCQIHVNIFDTIFLYKFHDSISSHIISSNRNRSIPCLMSKCSWNLALLCFCIVACMIRTDAQRYHRNEVSQLKLVSKRTRQNNWTYFKRFAIDACCHRAHHHSILWHRFGKHFRT